jgi:hypothetical protein
MEWAYDRVLTWKPWLADKARRDWLANDPVNEAMKSLGNARSEVMYETKTPTVLDARGRPTLAAAVRNEIETGRPVGGAKAPTGHWRKTEETARKLQKTIFRLEELRLLGKLPTGPKGRQLKDDIEKGQKDVHDLIGAHRVWNTRTTDNRKVWNQDGTSKTQRMKVPNSEETVPWDPAATNTVLAND